MPEGIRRAVTVYQSLVRANAVEKELPVGRGGHTGTQLLPELWGRKEDKCPNFSFSFLCSLWPVPPIDRIQPEAEAGLGTRWYGPEVNLLEHRIRQTRVENTPRFRCRQRIASKVHPFCPLASIAILYLDEETFSPAPGKHKFWFGVVSLCNDAVCNDVMYLQSYLGPELMLSYYQSSSQQGNQGEKKQHEGKLS